MSNYTPLNDIPKIHASLLSTFRSNKTKPLGYRVAQLHSVARFAQENSEALAHCLNMDLGRPRQESLCTEINVVVQRALNAAESLEKWTHNEDGKVDVEMFQKNWKVRVEKCPKGVGLIIVPWNYPVVLALQPLIGAIAAGCCAAIKLSEMAPAVASFIAENLGKYVDSDAYKVILGGVPEITKVLEMRWDHIIYTGNSKTARIIATAAARYLTPVTLELGGKSPVIIDPSTDFTIAAKRILWGKINNAGQICVAPDYVVLIDNDDPSLLGRLVDALKEACDAFFPQGALYAASNAEEAGDSIFGRIVNEVQFERLMKLMEGTKGKVVFGGKSDKNRRMIEPTVVEVMEGDVLLEEEIFGPILPVMRVRSVDDALDFVNQREHPLTLYLFSEDDRVKQQVVDNTMSGQVMINDTVMHLTLQNIPFGGIGESGYGRQFGKSGFEEFMYERPVIDVPMGDEPFFAMRYPPYSNESIQVMKGDLDRVIPVAKN